ncbi:MAG: dTMP kinase [Deltaproteobacteria bacterium]|nr:dTMP kinase [Deltaproteobacteria bacterium]
MSLFITFEGIEGSGKTTQIKILDDILKLRGYETVLTREPGGTAIGDQIRTILLDSENTGILPLCELFLYASARAQHVQQVIEPALAAKKIVLCDRFTDATLAYQGYGRDFSLEMISAINHLAVGKLKPGLTFLMDCDPEIGLRRARERIATQVQKSSEDRFENEAFPFHERVREGYLAIARAEPERVIIVNANPDVEAVHQEIVKNVSNALHWPPKKLGTAP